MPKKVNEELSDPYQRIISEPIGYLILQKQPEETEWAFSGGDRQWQPIPSFPLAMGWESSIDLSGYANQNLTFFPESGFMQQPPVIALDGGAALHLLTVITTVPQNIDTLWGNLVFSVQPSVLSEEWSTILYSRYETWTADNAMPSSIGFLSPQGSAQTGSLEPTAADKLYVYRIAMPYGFAIGQDEFTRMQLPSCRVGLIGQMAEEPTLEYMMRLKRSYELANQV